MREKQLFRFTLLIVMTAAFGLWGLWGFHKIEAREQDRTVERIVDYQNMMEKTCQTSPQFAACISNEEYLVKRLGGILEGMKANDRADRVMPWAICVPILILFIFYTLRWAVNGKFRPLWLL